MYSTLGAGWTFVLLSGLVLLATPCPIIVTMKGRSWRDKRKAKKAAKKEKKEAKKEKMKIEAELVEKQANSSDAKRRAEGQMIDRTNVEGGVGTKV